MNFIIMTVNKNCRNFNFNLYVLINGDGKCEQDFGGMQRSFSAVAKI